MNDYLDLTDDDIKKLAQTVVEFVGKDITNAFPLIIKKSFSLLNIPEILGVKDKENEMKKLQSADAFLIDLEEQIKTEVLASAEAILNNYKF